MAGSQRITAEDAVTSLVDADVLYKDNTTTGSGKIAFSDLKNQVEIVARKGVASGYAELDSTGKVPAAQLRSAFTIEQVADAAARNALTVLTAEIGVRQVRLADTGVIYVPNAAGTGSGLWVVYNSQGYASTSAQGNVELATNAEARDVQAASALLVPTVASMQAAIAPLRNALAPAQGLAFNGLTGSAQATLPAAFGTNDATIECEFDVPAAIPAALNTIWYVATARAEGTASEIGLSITTAGTLQFVLRHTSGSDVRTATVDSNLVTGWGGQRVKIALTRTAGTLVIYLNGVSVAFTAAATGGGAVTTFAASWTGTLLTVGKFGDNYQFTGAVGPVRCYNRLLTAAQVLANFERGAAADGDYNSATDTIGTALASGDDSTFASATGNWTLSSATISGGKLNMSAGGTAILNNKTLKAGQTYRYSVDVDSSTGALIWLFDGSGYNVSAAGAGVTGTRTGTFTMVADGNFRILSETGASVLDNVSVVPTGLLIAPEATAPGNGLVWNDRSGNGAHIVLPTGGVAWVLPDNRANRIRGTTSTSGNQALLAGGTILPATSQITRIRGRSRSGTPTITLGTASGGAQLVASVALSTTWKDLTIALTGGIVSTADDIWVGSGSTDVVEIDITHEPLGF